MVDFPNRHQPDGGLGKDIIVLLCSRAENMVHFPNRHQPDGGLGEKFIVLVMLKNW